MERSPVICIQEVASNLDNEQRLRSTIISNNINHYLVDTVRFGYRERFETLVLPLTDVKFKSDREIIEPVNFEGEVYQFGRLYDTEHESIAGHEEIVEEVATWMENDGHLKIDD